MHDVDQRIAQMARRLRLGNHVVHAYKSLRLDDPGEFVEGLLAQLIEARDSERARRNCALAGFESQKALADFDFSVLDMPARFSVDWLRSGQFIKDRQNLVLIGNPGTGKTHLATGLGIQCCETGGSVIFSRTTKLVDKLIRLHNAGRIAEFMKKLERCDLLILDEWGYLPINETGTRLLFEVINDCYERRSVVITTNLPLGEWNRTFGDERLTAAMVDRLVHHGLLIRHQGESYRIRQSLMRH